MKPRKVTRLNASVCLSLVLAAAGIFYAPLGQADDATSDDQSLQTVTVVAKGVSNMSAASAGDIGQVQLDSQPLLRPAAILENVPGLIVTQH